MSTPKYTLPNTNWMSPSSGVANYYTGAVNTQAADYDRIMGGYKNLFETAQANNASSRNLTFNPLTAPNARTFTPSTYNRSGTLDSTLNTLQSNSETGGFSEGDINNIRARGVSPIRAVYTRAMENLARQKSLQGGYSPNYGALQAKMAREQSSILSDKLTDVNAGIADRVISGKQQALNQLAPLAANENTLISNLNTNNMEGVNKANDTNASEVDRVNQFNKSMELEVAKLNEQRMAQNQSSMLAPLQGQQSLYGTTPALSSLFGQQVLQSGQQNIAANSAVNQQNNARAGMGLNLINSLPPIQYGTNPYAPSRRG